MIKKIVFYLFVLVVLSGSLAAPRLAKADGVPNMICPPLCPVDAAHNMVP